MFSNTAEQKLAKGLFLGLLTVFFASTVSAVAKQVSTLVDISTIIFFQYLICFSCTLPWLFRNGHKALKTQRAGLHITRSISGCGGFYVLYTVLQSITLVDATLLRTTAPLLVPIVIFFWLNKHIPTARWLPLIIGFLGIVVILRPGQQGLSIWHLVGLLSGLSLAVSMVSTRLLVSTEPASRILFYYFATALLFAIPFFVINYQPISLEAYAGLIYIGLFMYFSFALYTNALKSVRASVLAPTSYFAVVFSGLLDWVFWAHLPDLWTVAGTLLIVVGGLLLLHQETG